MPPAGLIAAWIGSPRWPASESWWLWSAFEERVPVDSLHRGFEPIHAAGTRLLESLRFRSRWKERQEQILKELFHATRHPWFISADDLPEGWPTAAEATARLPDDPDAQAFLNTAPITYGAWHLYAAPGPRPIVDLPDAFRRPAAEVHTWLARNAVDILVASWHDDVDWRIFVRYLIG